MNSTERSWGTACHLAALLGYVIPFGWILGPLVVWLIKKNDYAFVDDQGKESINFQITMIIYGIISAVLCVLLIGFILLLALAIFQIVMVIIAAVKTSNGEAYRYPLTIRFLK